MPAVQITITLSEDLARQANALGILSNEHLEALIRADIQAQLAAMAEDGDIQRELSAIQTEFGSTESDGLDHL